MPTDSENNQTNSNSDVTSQEQNNQSEEDDEEVVFHPHKGKIMQILQYTNIHSLSFDKSYEEPTGTGKVELILDQEDAYKYIYDGVACKLKVRRDTDRQFSDTGLEEVFDKEEDIHLREHYPTTEMLMDNQDVFVEKEFTDEEYKDFDVASTVVSRSASDDCLYGFVTEVNRDSKKTEVSLKDWGYCLEDTTLELTFNGLFRSELMAEVVKSYGLVPIIDLSGLEDDVVSSWTNKKTISTGTDSGETGDGSASESDKWTQCSTTYDLSIDAKVSTKGDIPSNITSEMMGKIGKADTNYGRWAKGKTAQEVLTGLRSVYKWRSGYSDNAIYDCPDEYFSTESIYVNCADAARLVKCCMDVIGVDCICVHCPNHYYNAIRVDGKWYTCDLTYRSSCKTRTGSNTFGY